MKRRTFVLGAGSAAAGGAALLGSGAFSRVESQRAVTVAVAEDPDAYVGIDKCRQGDPPYVNNSSFTDLDENGHLEIDMGIAENPGGGGTGVNSDSISSFDGVFQICNQGKQDACVGLEYDPKGVPNDGKVDDKGLPYPGSAAVFYVSRDTNGDSVGRTQSGSDLDGDLVFAPNGPTKFEVPLGECICIGIQTRTLGIDAENGPANLLNEVSGAAELRIISDVGENCDTP